MSMCSTEARPARTAASTTTSGAPTKVITVRLVDTPGSTSSRVTPSTEVMAAAMASMTLRSLPSEKFGTHSTSGDGMPIRGDANHQAARAARGPPPRPAPRRAAAAPPRPPPPRRWLDRLRFEPGAGEQERDHRVRVPHLPRTQLVPAPDPDRHRRRKVEDVLRHHRITGEHLWARHRA